jgi:hypothetical protein
VRRDQRRARVAAARRERRERGERVAFERERERVQPPGAQHRARVHERDVPVTAVLQRAAGDRGRVFSVRVDDGVERQRTRAQRALESIAIDRRPADDGDRMRRGLDDAHVVAVRRANDAPRVAGRNVGGERRPRRRRPREQRAFRRGAARVVAVRRRRRAVDAHRHRHDREHDAARAPGGRRGEPRIGAAIIRCDRAQRVGAAGKASSVERVRRRHVAQVVFLSPARDRMGDGAPTNRIRGENRSGAANPAAGFEQHGSDDRAACRRIEQAARRPGLQQHGRIGDDRIVRLDGAQRGRRRRVGMDAERRRRGRADIAERHAWEAGAQRRGGTWPAAGADDREPASSGHPTCDRFPGVRT